MERSGGGMSKKSKESTSGYDWIIVIRDGTRCQMTYRVTGMDRGGRMDWDDDVSDYTDDQIREHVCDMLGIDHKFKGEVDVTWD
jgi:hypothetical protein